jgi:PelA/Pel-15E family pectate lyase
MTLNLNITGFFGRNPNYITNILINDNLAYKITNREFNTAYITLIINKVLIKRSTIDVYFTINNKTEKKSIINPTLSIIIFNTELNVKLGDILKITAFVSGIIPSENYTIDIKSNIYLYIKTLNVKNLININNSYNIFKNNLNIKIINELLNKSTNNFRITLDNFNYIIGEKYILSFPSNYNGIIFNKFIKENLLHNEILNNLSNKIINITSFDEINSNMYSIYINNALSQLLSCGWWCKNYCDINVFNYGQIPSQYNYGSLQDATGLFIIKLIILSLKINFDSQLFLYFKKMIDYLINIQYTNGGIPQYYPLQGGYFNNICINDGAFLNYLKILDNIIDNISDNLLDNDIIQNLINCQKKAFNLLKQLQIKINNIPTIWAMQYDPITLKPIQARTFEPACLGSLESCQILIYLKEINFTYNNYYDIELKQVFDNGKEWFFNNSISSIVQTIKYDETNKPISLYIYNVDYAPSRLWARMYDIETLKPIYVDRQGNKYDDLNLLDYERKLGYTWLGIWGEYLMFI